MVPGEGPSPAIGMIVGEAPGRDEVALGKPFVGRAGVLLSTALAALGVPRESVYITNAVKELPLTEDGSLRPPTREEIEMWRPMLWQEQADGRPKAVLLLGRVAQMSVLRGRAPFGARFPLMGPAAVYGSSYYDAHTAWHPSYVLRQGGEGSMTYEKWLEQLRPWADALS